MNELTIIPSAEVTAQDIEKNIEAINQPVAEFLQIRGSGERNRI